MMHLPQISSNGKLREPIFKNTIILVFFLCGFLVAAHSQAESRLKAHFSLDGIPHPASLTISDGISKKVFRDVTYIDEIVPSEATYQLQWDVVSKRETYDVTTGTVRDVIPNLRIPPNETLELNIYLFKPVDRQSVTPAYFLFAEEPDANASVLDNDVVENFEPGITRVTTLVKGRPNKRIFLGSWASVRTPDLPSSEPFCFISCAVTTEVASEVPGGQGGAEPEPAPSSEANSCIDDGTAGGGKNYPAIIPESGDLKLITNINVLDFFESDLLLFATLRNGSSIRASSFEIRNAVSNELVDSSISNPLFRVPVDLPYIFSFAVPKAGNPDETYRLAFPIKGIPEGVIAMVAFAPEANEFREFTPVVVGDTELGMAISIEKTEVLKQKLSFDVLADGVGWILIAFPKNTSFDEIVRLHNRDKEQKTKLREGINYTLSTTEEHRMVVVKVEDGRDSYSIEFH